MVISILCMQPCFLFQDSDASKRLFRSNKYTVRSLRFDFLLDKMSNNRLRGKDQIDFDVNITVIESLLHVVAYT